MTRRLRTRRSQRGLALLIAVLGLGVLRAASPERESRGAEAASSVAMLNSSVAPAAGIASAGGHNADLAVAAALNGGTQFVELATRVTRVAGSEAGNQRSHAAATAALQLHHSVRSELDYLTSLLRRRSGADPGYTSTPPPPTVRT